MKRRNLCGFSTILIVFVCLCCLADQVKAANILGLFTSYSQSHLIVHMSVAKVLAEEGHNVTVVASQMPTMTHDKINLILIPPSAEHMEMTGKAITEMAIIKTTFLRTISNFFGSLKPMIDMQADLLKDARFIELYKNPDTKFDLVILGYFINSFALGVAAKFQAPIIISWMAAPTAFSNRLVGNPNEVSYVPDMNVAVRKGEKMTFWQRVQNLFYNEFYKIIKLMLDVRMRIFYRELFLTDDGSFPSLRDMERNVSLIFCNSHFTEGAVRPNVPAIVEIGGIQVKEIPDPLPQDIAKFLHTANETGAILFSLGSTLKGSSIKSETATDIFKAFSKLKQKIIWKWEDLEKTPGKSPNILYKKWMPQDDILAHPNIKLFITHAGKGGIAEAQYHGIPMVALPIFADQHGNAQKMVSSGYGQSLDLLTLTEKTLNAAIMNILNNPQYQDNVKTFSKLYRDRPLTPRQSVAYWTNYVIRHHGAAHMQSPLVHMNLIESLNLDVYLLLLLVLVIVYKLIKLVITFVISFLKKQFSKSYKEVNNRQKVKSH